MTNRGIIFTKKDTAELVEVDMPEPNPGEVRVRLVYKCGEVYARLAKGGAFPVVQFNWEET